MNTGSLLNGKVRRVPVREACDARGALTAIEFSEFGFQATRAFLVAAPSGAVRGGHGHRKGRQILMHVSGRIEIELRTANQTQRVMLDEANKAWLIEPPVWARQTYLGEDPAMIVFCDTPYDPGDYKAEPEDAHERCASRTGEVRMHQQEA